jgi:hypothetical protein
VLKAFAAFAPLVALVLIGVLLLEPPSLTPGDRVPTLRLLTSRLRDRASTETTPSARLRPYLGRWRIDVEASPEFEEDVEPYLITLTIDGAQLTLEQAFRGVGGRATARFALDGNRAGVTFEDNTLVLTQTAAGEAGTGARVVVRLTTTQGGLELERTTSDGLTAQETSLVFLPLP